MSTKQKALQTTVIVLSIATITSIILYYYLGSSSSDDVEDDTIDELRTNSKGKPDSQPDGRIITSKKTKSQSVSLSDAATPLINNTSAKEEKTLHAAIEELDKKGKEYFKEKKYLEAAEVFTGALDLIANYEGLKTSTSLARQISTLTNNRSAMYEKAGLFDLALIDCNTVLEQDVNHQKARIRILRILESQERYGDALVQICALQLKFMQENRAQLRMGIPLQPPVSQQKLEDTVAKLIPAEVEKCMQDFSCKKDRSLPSPYTLGQLLKSFSGYNSWMSKAARFGNIATLNVAVEEASDKDAATRASCLWKRGLRHTHDKSYELAAVDFEAAYALVENDDVAQDAMVDDEYARLLEWIGMIRHWKYDLDGAREIYEKCSQLEPTNVSQ
jgi:tetratricopeptide (TPR) repeat protein